jgi:acetyl-CoA C-acetyltransferase
MLKEIHLVGNFYAAFADVSAVELGKAAVERSGVKPEDVKELLVGNILSGALRPNAARQIEIGAGAPAKLRHF